MRLRSLLILPLLAALILLAACAAMQGGGGANIAGIAFMAPAEGQEAKGLYLVPDGRLLLLGDKERVGQSWKVTDKSLVLLISEDAGSTGKPNVYNFTASGGRLTLTPQRGGGQTVYQAVGAPGSLRDSLWSPVWLRGAEKLTKPYTPGLDPFLHFGETEATVDGFAGVNRFHGAYKLGDEAKAAFGPLISTRRAGPGMPWEAKFLEALSQADTMVVAGQRLYLFKETTPLAEFVASKK